MIPPEIDYDENDPSVTSWQGLADKVCERIEQGRQFAGMSADEADVSRLEKEIAELADEAPNLRRMAESRHADVVNMPDHYTKLPVECIDVTEHFNFTLGNAIKYIWRADHKGKPVEDLEKACWYIRREIDRRKRDHG